MIWFQTKLDPLAAPSYDVPEVSLGRKILLFFKDVVPMVAVMAIVVVMLLGMVYRCMTIKAFVDAVTGALRVTLMAFLIVLGSATFSQLLAFSGASSGLITWATSFDLSPIMMLLAIFAVLLVLGTFMEQISIMMITVPFFFPLAHSLGFDLIWFGVIVLLALEISFTTPPFGLLLFVMKGVSPPDTSMGDIYRAAIPYILCSVALVALLIAFPGLVTWLPSLLR